MLQQYEFTKAKIPDSIADQEQFMKKLKKYVSLAQYANSLQQKEIKPYVSRVDRRGELFNTHVVNG